MQAVWIYEAAVLVADRPTDLQQMTEIGNFHCLQDSLKVRVRT